MPPIFPKNKPCLEASWAHKVQDRIVSTSCYPRDPITVTCALEDRVLYSVLSVSRFIADEDPLFHKGFLERISNRDPEGVEELL